MLNEMASGGWTAEASSLESIVLVCAQANEPFFSLVRFIPQASSHPAPTNPSTTSKRVNCKACVHSMCTRAATHLFSKAE